MKYDVRSIDQMIVLYSASNIGHGIYVKNEENKIRDKIKLISVSNKKIRDMSSITFTVTTCKRWDLFKQTMDNLLIKCKDIEIVDKWLCVDDNSTEEDREKMRERYPFFTFIMKNENDKGHAKSMNKIWEIVDTDYIFHFEDDWFCYDSFELAPLLDYVKNSGVGHLILRKICSNLPDKSIAEIKNNKIFEYVYNSNHPQKPELNKIYDSLFNNYNKLMAVCKEEKISSGAGYDWWWPGFTLNPSIIHLSKIKRDVGFFKEDIRQELFEYDYAVRCHNKNISINLMNLSIEHRGLVSSYSLNEMNRYYDNVIKN